MVLEVIAQVSEQTRHHRLGKIVLLDTKRIGDRAECIKGIAFEMRGFFTRGDVDALARRLGQLMSSLDLREELRKNARTRVQKLFIWEHYFNELEAKIRGNENIDRSWRLFEQR